MRSRQTKQVQDRLEDDLALELDHTSRRQVREERSVRTGRRNRHLRDGAEARRVLVVSQTQLDVSIGRVLEVGVVEHRFIRILVKIYPY